MIMKQMHQNRVISKRGVRFGAHHLLKVIIVTMLLCSMVCPSVAMAETGYTYEYTDGKGVVLTTNFPDATNPGLVSCGGDLFGAIDDYNIPGMDSSADLLWGTSGKNYRGALARGQVQMFPIHEENYYMSWYIKDTVIGIRINNAGGWTDPDDHLKLFGNDQYTKKQRVFLETLITNYTPTQKIPASNADVTLYDYILRLIGTGGKHNMLAQVYGLNTLDELGNHLSPNNKTMYRVYASVLQSAGKTNLLNEYRTDDDAIVANAEEKEETAGNEDGSGLETNTKPGGTVDPVPDPDPDPGSAVTPPAAGAAGSYDAGDTFTVYAAFLNAYKRKEITNWADVAQPDKEYTFKNSAGGDVVRGYPNQASYAQLTSEQVVRLYAIANGCGEESTVPSGWEWTHSDATTALSKLTRANFEAAVDAGGHAMSAVPSEVYANSITKLSANSTTADSANWDERLTTWSDRVNALEAYLESGSQEALDDSIKAWYDADILRDMSIYPSLDTSACSSGNVLLMEALDAKEAYTDLYISFCELQYFADSCIPVISEDIVKSRWSEKAAYMSAFEGMFDTNEKMGNEAAKAFASTYKCRDSRDPAVTEKPKYDTLKEVYDALKKNKDQWSKAAEEASTGVPLSQFFSEVTVSGKPKLSDHEKYGFANSATYVPMRTNMYDPYIIAGMDEDFANEYHFTYGFNRKALFIDTNSDSATALYNSGTKGSRRVCTLQDLLEYEKEIVLYIDPGLYNIDKLAEVQGRTGDINTYDNAEGGETTESKAGQAWDSVTDVFVSDIKEICKTAGNNAYSTPYRRWSILREFKLFKGNTFETFYPEATLEDVDTKKDNQRSGIMSSGQINYYLNADQEGSAEYSPLQPFAVVSAIYRNLDMFNFCQSYDYARPVFISSSRVCCLPSTTTKDKKSILNYALLANLKAAMPIDYENNIDMEQPVYMDIYGNILTESGIVVVPAASNTTLMSDAMAEDMYSAGLFSIYGKSYHIPKVGFENADVYLTHMFEIDSSGTWYIPKARINADNSTDMSRLSVMDVGAKEMMKINTLSQIDADNYGLDTRLMTSIMMETLRGAPIENIDKDREGINPARRLSKAGLVAAAKLEELQDSLNTKGTNTVLAIPNLAFMEGLEYVVLFAYKIIILILIIVSLATVYTDVVSGGLGFYTLIKCGGAALITLAVVVAIPTAFDVTYYQSNKLALQHETSLISMLNYEKDQAGVEIGVRSIEIPSTSTKLLVKLDDIKIPWYDLFSTVMFKSTFSSLSQVYDEAAQNTTLSGKKDVVIYNDGVYVDVNRLLNSTDITFDAKHQLTHKAKDGEQQTASFYLPYYVFVDALCADINNFNNNPPESIGAGWYSYSVKYTKGAKLQSVGLAEAYFTSEQFMQGYDAGEDSADIEFYADVLGISEIYDSQANSSFFSTDIFTDEQIGLMQHSSWFSYKATPKQIMERQNYMAKYTREYIADNRQLLGKVSDEAFIKSMALDLALEYNRVFGLQNANAFEIYNLANEDLMRLSIARRDRVMENSTMGFPRFVYEVGGTPAVYAAAVLEMVTWVSGFVKPLAVIVTFLVVFVSLFVFKVCFRKENTSLLGYVVTVALICLTNLLYALILKLSIALPAMGLSPTVCILFQIAIQVVYMALLVRVVMTAFKDWPNLGFNKYNQGFINLTNKIQSKMNPGFNKTTPYGGDERRSDPEQNWEMYDRLRDEGSERR